MPTLRRDDAVFVLDLGEDENRFTPAWVSQTRGLLDEVASAGSPSALVTTARGKFFSNGLDLEWLTAHPDELAPYVGEVQAMLAQLLALGVPTVAAIQGHAFAAGAMLALAHDWRVMRADRGFLCLPEVDIHIPFTPGMDALIRTKLPPATAVDAMTTGARYGGKEAAAAGAVTAAVAETDVLPTALERAAALAGKSGPTLATIKSTMFAEALRLLHEPVTTGPLAS